MVTHKLQGLPDIMLVMFMFSLQLVSCNPSLWADRPLQLRAAAGAQCI